jgi:hypothetical protein
VCKVSKGKDETIMSGEQLKLKGIERVKRHNREWMERANWIVPAIAQYGSFTCDDVRSQAKATGIGNPEHFNAWGALLNTLARQGKIRRVGYRPSTLPSTHGRIVSVWEGVR